MTAEEDFTVTLPTVSSVSPDFGPVAGGSSLRVEGTGLDVGPENSEKPNLPYDEGQSHVEVEEALKDVEVVFFIDAFGHQHQEKEQEAGDDDVKGG